MFKLLKIMVCSVLAIIALYFAILFGFALATILAPSLLGFVFISAVSIAVVKICSVITAISVFFVSLRKLPEDCSK